MWPPGCGIISGENGRPPREVPMPPDGLIRLVHATYAAPSPGATDAELLGRCAARTDDAAFELLVRRHADLVWRVCRSVARDARGGVSLSVGGAGVALAAGPASAAPRALVSAAIGAIAAGTLSPAIHSLARGAQTLMTPTRLAPLVTLVAGLVVAAGAVLAF